MGSPALQKAREKMVDAGVDEVAIDTFAHYFRLLEHGETGHGPRVDDRAGRHATPGRRRGRRRASPPRRSGTPSSIKLNGGLGTSMGMDRAKSLLCVRRGLSFLDIIARQVLHLRQEHDATLPLIFMNCFRTSADTMAALGRYDDLAGRRAAAGVPAEQGAQAPRQGPHRRSRWPNDPDLEWCPPGHGDLYTALRGTGLIDLLLERGYRHVFVSNSDNLGAVPDPRVAGWFAAQRCAVRDRGRAPHAVGPQGRPLRPPQDRRPAGAARDRADPAEPTRTRWPTSTGTGSARPTTCGSTWPR